MRRSLFFLTLCCLLWPAAARAQTNPLANCGEDWGLEKEAGGYQLVEGSLTVYEGKFTGNVRVECKGMILQADEIHWRTDSPMVYASGNVYFMQGGTEVDAQRAEMNRTTHLGTFYQASGQMKVLNEKPDRSLFGTQEPHILFWAEKIEKVAAEKFKLTQGGFTSCRQPTPRWDMSASTLTLVPDDHAVLRNMVLRVKDVPLFYLPALYYPITHTSRATGFLIPNYTQSTVRGLGLSNAFFWAVNRSQDVTIYHDYYAKSGNGLAGEYRYAGTAGSGNARMYMLDERARFGTDGTTVLAAAHRSFDFRGNINQAIGTGTRVTGNVNYFTDIQTQQLYQQNLYDLSLRTRSFSGAVSGGKGRVRLGAQMDRTDVFTGTRASRYGSLPTGTFSISEKPIGRSPIYLGGSVSGGSIIRQDDISDPTTNRSVWRVDGSPTISVPVSSLPALTVTTSAALRYTFWSDQIDLDLGEQVSKLISRRVLDVSARAVGPVVSRIWHTPGNGYAEGFKHLIEPSVTVGWVSAYKDAAKIVQLDGVDTLVTGTTTLNYGFANRLLAKRKTGGETTGVVREILNVDVRQTYYTNARAAQYDPNYQSSFAGLNYHVPPSPFSPVQLSATARPSDTSSAQFRMEYDTKFGAVRTYGASASVDQPAVEISAGWSKRQHIPGLSGFDNPAGADHFLNINTTVRDPGNSIGGAYNFSYDLLRDYYLQRRVRVYYNSQCCGVAFDFQTVDLSHIGTIAYGRSDRRISLSFTLAGIGTFSNPLSSFGGNNGSR
jgi:LPS-assembly protein